MENTDKLTLTICNGLIFGKVADTIFRRAHTRIGVRSVFYNSFIPFNPRTEKQQQGREFFKQGMAEWRGLSEPEKEIYRVAVKRLPMHGVNLFLKFFLAEQRKNAELFLVADWQRVLQQKALQWATERVCERELAIARF
jgi:hypothetical protein